MHCCPALRQQHLFVLQPETQLHLVTTALGPASQTASFKVMTGSEESSCSNAKIPTIRIM